MNAMRTRLVLAIAGTLLPTLATTACAGGDDSPPVVTTVSDSAGIPIVENRVDTAALRSGWSIAAQPQLTIGGLDAPESQQLFEIAGARRLPDGRIAVADGGSAEIRIYDAAGTLLTVHGRRGEGPGEFMQPRLAGVTAGDSLVVYDGNLRRVSILLPDSGFVRSYLVGGEGGGFPVALGTTADGGPVFGGGMYFSSQDGFPSGVVRPLSRYVLVAPDGSLRGDLGDIPAAEMFARTSGRSFSASRLPFGRVTAAAAAPDRLWLGTGDSWQIRAFTPDARLARIVRFDLPLAPVTSDLVDADLAERLEDAADENEARQVRASMAEIPIPQNVPPYEYFLVDALNHLWIGEYLLPAERARTFIVIDSAGNAVGRLTMPERTRPVHIGEDFVLGISLDDLDVERLTLWSLERPAR